MIALRLTFLLLACAAASGQQIHPPLNRPQTKGLVAGPLRTGDRALKSGDLVRARFHYQRALGLDPYEPGILEKLLIAAGDDLDTRLLWTHTYARAIAPDKGFFKPARKISKLIDRKDPHPQNLGVARAAAVKELLDLVGSLKIKERPQEALMARWYTVLAQAIAHDTPALARRHGARFNRTTEPFVPATKNLITNLKGVMDKAVGAGDIGFAIRVGRCIRGLAAQAGFKDLKGPKAPELKKIGMAAARAVGRLRKRLTDGEAAVLSIEQLEGMSPAEREAFTTKHSLMGAPGVALSTTGKYRVETTCGHATLLGVARTVELHHQRLVAFYGGDPFKGRLGLIRVTPENHDLEAEGAPYWWVGGFQGGDTTTVQMSCSTIEGLGHTLTHELTHRFDGTLLPGLPAWLSEGRAVWTGRAYGHSSDPKFVPNHLAFGTIESAFIKGYGGEDKLKDLIEGKIEDYRDNYSAGYALYAYLHTWQQEGEKLFNRRLVRYMSSFRQGRGNLLERFTRMFADGKLGRPTGMKEFAKGFRVFLKGFYWQSRAVWTARYTRKVVRKFDPHVYDTPTWTWLRNRSEPWFGQDQARKAGQLFLEANRPKDAAFAWCWALLVDEWDAAFATRVAGLLDGQRLASAAWCVRSEAERLFPGSLQKPLSPPPFKGALGHVFALVRAHQEAVEHYEKAQRPLTALALAADHDRLAHMLGAKLLNRKIPTPAKDAPGHPLNQPAGYVGLRGWVEDDLSGHEERRARGLWYEDDDLDLHIGRKRPRKATGSTDRRAHQRDAFTRTKERFPSGRYVLKTRIHPTTSFISGAVILGYARRDRNVRVHFSAGDFMYSIGAKEEKTKLKSMRGRVGGLRTRDGPLWGSSPATTIRFKNPVTSFRLEILIDGGAVHAFVDDRLVGSYHTPDGRPVEGHIGFATGHGAYRLQEPTIQRLDRSPEAGRSRPWPRGLDLAAVEGANIAKLRNRRIIGLPVSPSGTFVVWTPRLGVEGEACDGEVTFEAALEATRRLARLLEEARLHQPVAVVVPEEIGAKYLKDLRQWLENRGPRPVTVHTHRRNADLDPPLDPKKPRGARPVILFQGPQGLLRTWVGNERVRQRVPRTLRHWGRVFHIPRKPQPAGNDDEE